jgi:DNA polymerase V
VDKRLAADQLVLTLGYDIENLADPQRRSRYKGPITTDHYGRKVPKHAHGTAKLGKYTSSAKLIVQTAMDLFDRIADPDLLVRRINIVANHVIDETAIPKEESVRQLDLFTDVAALDAKQEAEEAELARERKKQEAVLAIKRKYGKNAILKAMNLEEGATTRERNNQIGGHKA